VPLVPFAMRVAIWDSRRVFGSDWRSFEDSTMNDVTTAEKSPALRNPSLISDSVCTNWTCEHTKINKFWTLSFQASHWTLSFAKRGSNKVSQGSSLPLGIGYRYGSLYDHCSGFWNQINQQYAEGCARYVPADCGPAKWTFNVLVLSREKALVFSHNARAVYLGKSY